MRGLLRGGVRRRPHAHALAAAAAAIVPPSTHLSQLRVTRIRDAAREAKVANGEVAVGVDEQVARLEVAVEDLGRVHELEPAQHLVREVLHVLLAERLRGRDDALHVALEQRHDDVQRVEVLAVRRRRHHVQHLDDVVVLAQVTEQHDLAQDALGVDEVGEHARRALDGHARARQCVVRRDDKAVRAAADGLEVLHRRG